MSVDISGGAQTPCAPDVFKEGVQIGMLVGANSTIIECIVKEVARITGTQTDWHYFAGRAVVLTLGDPESVRAVLWQLTEPLTRKAL